jgi:hypothetical protein
VIALGVVVLGVVALLVGVAMSIGPVVGAARRSDVEWPSSPRFRAGMLLAALGTLLVTLGALGVG